MTLLVVRALPHAGKPTPTHAAEIVGVGLAETEWIASGNGPPVWDGSPLRTRPTRSPQWNWPAVPSLPRDPLLPSQISIP
jgi:hypothetical protein